ncbi:hypothetical protein LTR10_004089 [Elasticomyces elasticus]|nr:hypothetical protein LTR10_004089 [Elasticomyces elasticus]KAK4977723.1 hypothetical protein LTR42_002096 [Elasticomyces elasticus]
MGALDIYCAICGGPFRIPTVGINSATIQLDNLAWLERLLVVGRNVATNRAYVSGPGTVGDYGWVVVDAGEDVNAPLPKMMIGPSGGKISQSAYCDWGLIGDGSDFLVPFPVHCQCFEMLGIAHAGRTRRSGQSVSLDLEGLRTVMQKMLQGKTDSLGGMQYYEFEQVPGECIWEEAKEVEIRKPYLYDPTALIQLDVPLRNTIASGELAAVPQHPFARLPTELLYDVLEQITGSDLLRLIGATPAISWRLDTSFWRKRIRSEMPYMLESEIGMPSIEADWKCLFEYLLKASFPPLRVLDLKTLDERSMTIASRRRVWQCAQQLLNAYDEINIPSVQE